MRATTQPGKRSEKKNRMYFEHAAVSLGLVCDDSALQNRRRLFKQITRFFCGINKDFWVCDRGGDQRLAINAVLKFGEINVRRMLDNRYEILANRKPGQ